MSEMILVTRKLIDSAKTPPHGWKREALQLLGVPWPPRKGWKHRILGTRITAEAARRLACINQPMMLTTSERRRRGNKRKSKPQPYPVVERPFAGVPTALDAEFNYICDGI